MGLSVTCASFSFPRDDHYAADLERYYKILAFCSKHF